MAMKQFGTPLGISTLPDVEFDEILGHSPTEKGWSSTKNFIYFTSRANGESTLTTSGEVGVYQKRSGGKILQHIFSKEHWDKDKAREYLEGLAEKAIKLLSLKLRFEDIEPVKLSKIDDEDLEEDHARLHRYYAEWLVGKHREDDDWSYGDLLQKHSFVVAELKKRGRGCEYDDELAKPIRKGLVGMIKGATESFVWEGWDEPVLIVKGGPGSGHHGHAGRPGQVGGSATGLGGLAVPVGDAGEDGNDAAQDMLSKHSSYNGGIADETYWGGASSSDRSELKAQVARDLAKETGVTEEQAAEFVTQWARSSNDDDMRSLAIQKDAADEFGLELSEFTRGRIQDTKSMGQRAREAYAESKNPELLEFIEKSNPLMDSSSQRSLLRAMYNNTQSELKARGITEVRAYRGVFLTREQFSDLGGTKNVQIRGNALSSWSLSEDVATGFAGYMKWGQPTVFSTVVPANRILSFPTTGFGCLGEGELVILGGENDWAEVVAK